MAPAHHITIIPGERPTVRLLDHRAGGAEPEVKNVAFRSHDLMRLAIQLMKRGFTLNRLTFTDLYGQPHMMNRTPIEKRLRTILQTEGMNAVFDLANTLLRAWKLAAIEVSAPDHAVYSVLKDGSVYITTAETNEAFIESVEEYLRNYVR